MAQNTAEHIAATQMFIDANPDSITLNRPTRGSDGAGGTVTTKTTTVSAQTMRLVALNQRSASETRITVDGEMVVPTYALVTLPSADVRVGDQFTLDGKLYEVVFVQDRPGWRRRAEVFRHG